MIEGRLRDLMLWRDATLFRRGSEGAATRLTRDGRSVSDALASADAIEAPSADELDWMDARGEPLNPDHPWWAERKLSAKELDAIRRGSPL